MKTGSITYNGKNSLELGVYTTGSGSFDAAELDVDKYEIPGRNGDLILSNNRYKNIEITYPAFIPKAFMDKVQNVRNWLRSSRVYARLEDTYDTDHYRLGIPTGVQSFSPEHRNDGANFEMTFDCKPQRFLKVGETPETVEPDVQTVSGEIASFETDYVVPMTSAEVSLSPQQDLNGFDSPWPGGGGKNLFPDTMTSPTTAKGVTFTRNSKGEIAFSGTTSSSDFSVSVGTVALAPGSYILTGGISTSARLRLSNATGDVYIGQDNGSGYSFTLSEATTVLVKMRLTSTSGTSVSGTYKPMVRLASVTDATFAPYSNICPISGHTGSELIRTWKNVSETSSLTSTSSGNVTANAGHFGTCKAGQTYTISFDVLEENTYAVRLRFNNGSNLKSWATGALTVGQRVSFTYTPTADGWFNFNTASPAFPASTKVFDNVQVEFGSSATAYEPYQGTSYSVTFSDQGTVYGGTYDFVTGEGKITMLSYDLAGRTWTMETFDGNNVFSCNAISTKALNYNFLCNKYRNAETYRSILQNGECGCYNNTNGRNRISICDNAYSTVADFVASIADIQVVYELATPQTFSLSAQQIETLLGENNVWSDAGEITLTYAEPFTIENPTLFDTRPLFTVTNPAEGDVITVNGQTITFVDGYSGTVYIDCETMNAYSGAANLNSIIEATDFPVLVPGNNIVTWTGAGECTMTPRWWEL